MYGYYEEINIIGHVHVVYNPRKGAINSLTNHSFNSLKSDIICLKYIVLETLPDVYSKFIDTGINLDFYS